MSTIIAGRFDTQEHADAGMAALERAGFTRRDLQSFYISPPGMHGNLPIVDNEQPEVGTRHAGAKAAAGAVVGGAVGLAAGIAAAPLAAPAAAVAGAIAGTGVGAYGGSLIGSMQGAGGGEIERKAERGEPVERRSGILVAVCADTSGADRAIEALRAAGAQDIEHATGVWNEGEWLDFDPLSRPQLVD
ncbi:MAG TPA: hypothetical protein VHP37_13525 [Burkholderiales bacterium]|nr:hypothetical protein [Burkholderiales bacterium]